MAYTTSLRKLFSFLTLILILNMVLCSKDGANKKHEITITKSVSFLEFSPDTNPRLEHDVKLLGSASLSNVSKSIQIPDFSEMDDLRHLAGRAIYSSPVRVFDPISQTPASFETTFTFRLNNRTISSSFYNNTSEADDEEAHGGSGLTFLITPDEFTVGRAGPWLGMLNDACTKNYNFIAVEFDTRQNPEFGDPNDNHIGINLGSIVSKSIVNASDYGLSFEDGSKHIAQIVYDGPTKRMQIRVGSKPDYTLRSVFTDHVDITPFLNEYMFVGFSASTGNRTQIHNILSWNFTFKTPGILRYPAEKTCEGKILVGKYRVDHNKNVHVKKKKPSVTFLIFISVVVLCFMIVINLYCNGKRRQPEGGSAFLGLPEKKARPTPPNKPRRFTGAELSLATRGFSDWEVLGRDSSGVMYKGTLPHGWHFAIKRYSTPFLASLSMDRRRFLKRVGCLSRVRHPRLVPIRGWSYDTREYMVVYEYMFNGCVDRWLFGVGVLPWTRRFKVVKNVVNGLAYIHSRDLAHNNVQVSSVFLDVSFKALLGDFGLSDPLGIDPVSSRSVDVFYFGVMILEIVAGRKRWVTQEESKRTGCNTDDDVSNMDNMDLVDYAWILHETNEEMKIVDRSMGSGVDPEQAVRVVEIALLCTLPENNGRPKMEEIMMYLTTERELPTLPPHRPIVLFPYNSGPSLCGGYVCAPFGKS